VNLIKIVLYCGVDSQVVKTFRLSRNPLEGRGFDPHSAHFIFSY
jgi:hypothetical protein